MNKQHTMPSDNQFQFLLASFQEIWISFPMLFWRQGSGAALNTVNSHQEGLGFESPGNVCTAVHVNYCYSFALKRHAALVSPWRERLQGALSAAGARARVCVCKCAHLCRLQKDLKSVRAENIAAPPVGKKSWCLLSWLYQSWSTYKLLKFSFTYTLNVSIC